MAIRLALFDVLEGRFGGVTPVDMVSSDEHRVASIVGNLQRLLNTRQGSVPHLPNYGLPDLSSLRREGNLDQLRKAVRRAVTEYEPRLARVRVEHRDANPYQMRVTFVISGEVERGRRIQLETTFGSQEKASVRQSGRY
ncbi:MAG: type VI secretion system baseplate subunit TssE [Bacteroidota bacterium]